MQVKLTREQAVQVATNAVNASQPMGLGFLHAVAKDYTTEEVEQSFDWNGNAYFDYFQGRMTKLNMQNEGGVYEFSDYPATVDYQSWVRKYPTYEDLVDSVLNE